MPSADMDHSDDLETQDGRRARRDRNKIAVVDAYLELIREGNPRPSVADVAERSGVSHRSVFRYFADKDELARTSIERQEAAVIPMVAIEVDPDRALADRIDLLVQRRLALYDAIAPVARLTRSLAPLQPILQDELTRSRLFLRVQVKRLFAPELSAMSKTRAASTLAVLDVLCSFEVAELLRADQDLSIDRAADALRDAVTAILS
ncbi:unannotated protein [freshwater metagenome]|uniref:Unannotated protein n=1 Tax=freshwater metagenome TaxID=449393 RepID=A0A6J7EPJ6_9ZZZZ|nr:TetR family transcriptional regulator [Actinomycetota bacterium]